MILTFFIKDTEFLNQACAWFLKIDPVQIVSMCVCVCVCLSVPKAINNKWRDMDLIQLVKQVLQLLYDNCNHFC